MFNILYTFLAADNYTLILCNYLKFHFACVTILIEEALMLLYILYKFNTTICSMKIVGGWNYEGF